MRCYIRVFSNRYLHLSKILNTKKIDYFNYTKDSNSTNNNEIKNFIEKIKDDNFNDEIYQKIILFKKKKISIKVKKTKTNNSSQERFGLLNLFNLFSLKNEKIFISELYLSKIGNILLHLRLKIAPRFWSCVNFTKYSSLNSNLRIELNKKVKPKKINLDSFLLSNIFEYMPKAYLEDFNNISKFVKDKFPKKPEIIVTANSFFFNETFKNFVAQNYKQSIYCVQQHGNNYQSHYDEHFESIEEDTAHFFLSWFKKRNSKKYIETCMQKSIKKKKINDNLLILHWPFDQRDKIWDNFDEYSNYINKTKILLKKISSLTHVKKIDYRVSHNHNNIDNLLYFKKISKKIDFDFSKLTFNESVNNSKIALFTYNSSGFYENLSNNIPSLMIIDKTYLKELNKETKYDFKELIKFNLVFTDINKLLNFLKQNWNSIDEWWMSGASQDNIKKFVDKNAIRSNNIIKTLSSKIKNLAK